VTFIGSIYIVEYMCMHGRRPAYRTAALRPCSATNSQNRVIQCHWVHTSAAGRRKLDSISVHVVSDVSMTTQLAILMSFNVKQLLVLQTPYRLHDWDAVYVPASTRKENTTPFGVNLMRSQVLYRAAQGLKDVEVVLARPVVPPVSSSLQCISAVVL